jgi:hypothetical protein
MDLKPGPGTARRKLDQRAAACQLRTLRLSIPVAVEEPEGGSCLDRDGQPIWTGENLSGRAGMG